MESVSGSSLDGPPSEAFPVVPRQDLEAEARASGLTGGLTRWQWR